MGLNDTPSGNRYTIGLFGPRNVGKSSLVNKLLGQDLVLTSEVAGTTTDPVSKSMELLPIGPVLFVDTAGLDDEGELGLKRVDKSYEALCSMRAGKAVNSQRWQSNSLESLARAICLL